MKSSTATSTAFVLAGGGSFGAVQVGMLRALVAHGAWLAKGGLARERIPAALRGHVHTEGVGCLAHSD